jgi:hypothetical protein
VVNYDKKTKIIKGRGDWGRASVWKNGKGNEERDDTVLWKIERSRDVSPEALKNMVKNGLDAMVGAVEKAMYGVSDRLVKEWKEKEQREDDRKWRIVRYNEIREERRMKDEEKVRKLEKKLERALRENEDRWRERDERLKVMEDMMKREVGRKVAEGRGSKEQSRSQEEEWWENEITKTKVRVAALENRIREGERSSETEKEYREAHVRIDELEKDIAKDRAERQEFEWSIEGDKGIQDAKDSEKDMGY